MAQAFQPIFALELQVTPRTSSHHKLDAMMLAIHRSSKKKKTKNGISSQTKIGHTGCIRTCHQLPSLFIRFIKDGLRKQRYWSINEFAVQDNGP